MIILDFLDCILGGLRPYRWLRGGHWERWYVDSPVNGDVWMQVGECSHTALHRPTGLCRGTPKCETHRC
jgi:hypothetical protein